MFKASSKAIRQWSIVGQRATAGLVINELAKSDERLIVVTADVSSSAGLDRFKKNFPEQFLDVGIAEQNMMGVAAGLADNGFNVVTTTFAPFQSLRCCEQIKVNLAYTNLKVVMIGLASGLVNGPLGNTHCCVEDFGALRSLPNLKIISPADGVSVACAIKSCLEQEAPCYIRLTGETNNSIVYEESYDFKIGQAINIKSGKDLTIFATGSVVHNCLLAAERLAQHGISASVWDMHTIKPIDHIAVRNAALNTNLIVSVEEHNVIGGLYSAIAECLGSERHNSKLLPIGIRDEFLKPGDYGYMLRQAGLTPQRIQETIMVALNSN